MKNQIFTFFISLLLIISAHLTAQTAGTLDPTFGNDGKLIQNVGNIDVFHDVAIQEDQKIVTVGMSFDAAYVSTAHVHRLLADGTPDQTFGTNGVFTYSLNFEANLYGCHIKPDGKILLSGETTDYQDYRIMLIQLNPDGTLDHDFGDNGIAIEHIGIYEDHCWGVAVLEDGAILVTGTTTTDYAGEWRNAPFIAKFSENGVLDTSFGDNGIAKIPVLAIENTFRCITVQPDGKILAAGHFANDAFFFITLVVRFMPDGTLDPTFADNGIFKFPFGQADSQAFDIAVTSDDKIIVTGVSVSPAYDYSMLLFRLDALGALDPGFGTAGVVITNNAGTYDVGYGLRIQPDNKIVIAGSTGNAPPDDNSMGVWRFNPDGSVDNTFAENGLAAIPIGDAADEAMGIALQADEKIVIAGKSRHNADIDFAVVRLLGDHVTSVSEPLQNKVAIYPDPVRPDGQVNISFELADAGKVQLEMTDISGRKIDMINLGNKPGGQQTAAFTLPAKMTQGVYMVSILANGASVATVKLVIAQ